MKSYVKHISTGITLIALSSFAQAQPENQTHSAALQKAAQLALDWHKVSEYLEQVPFQSLEITIPKSGTHLLSKCVCFLQEKNCARARSKKPELPIRPCIQTTRDEYVNKRKGAIINLIRRKICNTHKPIHQRRVSIHLAYTPERESLVTRGAKKALLLIRDPRDQLISFANWVCPSTKINTEDFNKLILDFIDGKQRSEVQVVRMYEACNMMWTYGIAEYYKMYLPWTKVSNVYTVRFENLIGELGGGSDDAQIKEIEAIAHHLGISTTKEKTHSIARNLFGGTSTFHKGQIGSWKTIFTDEHKAAFKEAAGQLLIDLGYEKDLNW